MWLLYDILVLVLLTLAAPFLLARRGAHYLPTLAGRLGGHRGKVVRGGLWIHAVSVGEVSVAATLVRALPPEVPLVVTTVTPTGQERARALFRDRAAVTYLPFDLGPAVGRFFHRFRPRALVLVEGDYWPRVLRAAKRRRLPVAVVNGRVGDKSFARMRRLRPVLSPLFTPVERFGVQGEGDRDRLTALGVPAGRITVTGNLKYESPEPRRHPELEAKLARLAGDRPLLVAGSTMAGEEEAVFEAFRRIGGGRALLVIAPRHPERWGEVERLAAGLGLATLRRSRIDEPGALGPDGGPDVVLLDSLGELAGLYAAARAAFVGGTLIATGGHNPLEPARFGVPTAVGPSMENFREIATEFDQRQAWARVTDPATLADVWRRWLDEPAAGKEVGARAQAVIEANRGALRRTVGMLGEVLEVVGAQDRREV